MGIKEECSHVQVLNDKGVPFHGKTQDAGKAALYAHLKKMASDLAEDGGFVQSVTAEPSDGGAPNVHVFVDFPDTVFFRIERKGTVPAMMNAADSWTLSVRNDGGIRLTLTVINLWKE